MLINTITHKLFIIFSTIPEEQKQIFVAELSKIRHTNTASDTADWRIGSGFDQEKELLQVNFTISIASHKLKEKIDLAVFFADLMLLTPQTQLELIDTALTTITEGIEKPYHLELGNMPVVAIDEKTTIIKFKITGQPSKKLQMQIQADELVLH